LLKGVTQNGDLVILDKPGYIEYQGTGTSHGTTYSYDTHVPPFFYGWHIKKGSFNKRDHSCTNNFSKNKNCISNGTKANVLEEVLDDK
jgi:hypothetical protein